MKHNKNILIVNTFGIGDVLFSTPLLEVLKRTLPGVEISYICNKRTCHVLKNNKNVSNIIVFEKDHFRDVAKKSKIRFLKMFLALCKKIKSLDADIMIDLTLNYRASLIGKILGIPRRIGFNYRNRGKFLTNRIELEGFDKKHVALYYLDLLKLIGLEIPDNIFTSAFCLKEDEEWADNFMKTKSINKKFILGVVPGGGKSWGNEARYRRWPVSHFAHVTDRLIHDFQIPILLFGDSTEAELCKNMESFMRNPIINIAGKTTVGQFMALVSRCSIIFCNEGGPLHISVALKIPTVSIFGPVDEKIYGPYSPEISKHIVVSNRASCLPCYAKFKHRKCESITCLNSISEDEAYNAIRGLMEKLGKQPMYSGNKKNE